MATNIELMPYYLLQKRLERLSLSSTIEINSGTRNTPGNQLRIIGYDRWELEVLQKSLRDSGFSAKMMQKGHQSFLLVQNVQPSSQHNLNQFENTALANLEDMKESTLYEISKFRLSGMPGIGAEFNLGTENYKGKQLRLIAKKPEDLVAMEAVFKEAGLNVVQIRNTDNRPMLIVRGLNENNIYGVNYLTSRINDKNQQLMPYFALQQSLKTLPLASRIEVNSGTANTPGNQLRIIGTNTNELQALKKSLQDSGFPTVLKQKGNEPFLVVQNITPKQQQNLGELVSLAQKNIAGGSKNESYERFSRQLSSIPGVSEVAFNEGTANNKGKQVRITANNPEGLAAIKAVLKEQGLDVTEIVNTKQQRMLIIRNGDEHKVDVIPNLSAQISEKKSQMMPDKENYQSLVLNLKRIDSDSKFEFNYGTDNNPGSQLRITSTNQEQLSMMKSALKNSGLSVKQFKNDTDDVLIVQGLTKEHLEFKNLSQLLLELTGKPIPVEKKIDIAGHKLESLNNLCFGEGALPSAAYISRLVEQAEMVCGALSELNDLTEDELKILNDSFDDFNKIFSEDLQLMTDSFPEGDFRDEAQNIGGELQGIFKGQMDKVRAAVTEKMNNFDSQAEFTASNP